MPQKQKIPNLDLNDFNFKVFISSPLNVTDPAIGSYILCINCNTVDFPHPDDPTNATDSPAFI